MPRSLHHCQFTHRLTARGGVLLILQRQGWKKIFRTTTGVSARNVCHFCLQLAAASASQFSQPKQAAGSQQASKQSPAPVTDKFPREYLPPPPAFFFFPSPPACALSPSRPWRRLSDRCCRSTPDLRRAAPVTSTLQVCPWRYARPFFSLSAARNRAPKP